MQYSEKCGSGNIPIILNSIEFSNNNYAIDVSPLITQVERFGEPTWRRLVETVEDKVGGKNPALARTIAGDHLCTPGNHIYCSLLPINV